MSPLAFCLLALTVVGCTATGGEAERLNQQGNERYRAGDYAGALTAYQQAAAERPDLTALSYNAGNTLHRLGQYERAVREAQRAAANGSNDVRFRAYYALGNHFVAQQKWREAYESYRNALVLSPGDLDAKYNLEIALQQLDQRPPPQTRQPQPPPAGQQPPDQNGQGNPGQGNPGQGQQPPQPGDGQGQPEANGQPGQGGQGQPAPGNTPGQARPGNQPADGRGRAPSDQDIKDALAEFERNLTIEDAQRILDLLAQQQRERQRQVPGPPPGSNIRDQ